MSLFESGHSSEAISLARVLAGEPTRSPDTGFGVPEIAERVAVGGWPGVQDRDPDAALRTVRAYVDEIRRLEVDAIVRRPGGPWAAFEVKLGGRQIDQAARTLLHFAERIDTSRTGEPAALGVIVGTGYGYTRPDGISVIPIAALGP